jgi:hypothetical protein
MTDDHNDRPGVNLEELERQLRVASRAHADANAFRSPQAISDQKPLSIPDIEALRRDFGRLREQDRPSFEINSDPEAETGPPPAFLSQPNGYSKKTLTGSFDDRFPVIDRQEKKGSAVFRALFSGSVALLMLGVGYSYFAGKFSVGSPGYGDSKSVPLIKADPNPVKISPEASGSDDVTPSGSELFGKKPAEPTSIPTSHSSAEAPVDINAVVKNSNPRATPLVPGLGDPKTVRTVSVRPDGTVIGEQAALAPAQPSNTAPIVVTPPPVAMAQDQQPTSTVTVAPQSIAPLNMTMAKSPAEPIPALQPSSTEPPTIGGLPVPLPLPRPVDLLSGGEADRELADPLAALVASTTEDKPKLALEVVPSQPRTPLLGDYTVQFGASPSEAEATTLAARLKDPLIDLLDGHPLAVVKGENGGKTVFRVRALGYSRDEAAATCVTAAATGIKCFIAKN